MESAEIRATRDGKSPVTTGICSSSQFLDLTGFSPSAFPHRCSANADQVAPFHRGSEKYCCVPFAWIAPPIRSNAWM